MDTNTTNSDFRPANSTVMRVLNSSKSGSAKHTSKKDPTNGNMSAKKDVISRETIIQLLYNSVTANYGATSKEYFPFSKRQTIARLFCGLIEEVVVARVGYVGPYTREEWASTFRLMSRVLRESYNSLQAGTEENVIL